MSKPVVHINNLTLEIAGKTLFDNLNWSIKKGENWLLYGPSGIGKTLLMKLIHEHHKQGDTISINFSESLPYKKQVLYVANWYEFTNSDGDRNFYYQQRYDSSYYSDTPSLSADLRYFAQKHDLELQNAKDLAKQLDLLKLWDSRLIELSSGEQKKLQLLKAFWLKPQLLVLDQPYNGLDVDSREKINALINRYIDQGVQFILVQNGFPSPQKVNNYASIENGQLIVKQEIEPYQARVNQQPTRALPEFLMQEPENTPQVMVRINEASIRYGEKLVLDRVSWEVKAHERWLLQGANGSGKSTLLSLLNADHPQAYKHDIVLFDQQRGSGESIWDIKRKIGMVSPELHWYFKVDQPVSYVVASGLFDSIGLYQDLPYSGRLKVQQVMEFFDLMRDKDRLLSELPLGRQRIALLARTVIKNPLLLILDEPCQGLDQEQTDQFNDFVDRLAPYKKTIIYVGHQESKLPKSCTHKLVLEGGKVKINEEIKTLQHITI